MRAYRLSNNDVVIDVRPHANRDKQLLRCVKVWCHRRENYCFKAIVTGEPIVARLNPSETRVVLNQLALAIAKGRHPDEEPPAEPEVPWYEKVQNAILAAKGELA